MEQVSDFVGTTTIGETDKWAETGLTKLKAANVKPPLLAECPVNIDCRVVQVVRLPSHSMFIAEVLIINAEDGILDDHGEVDFALADGSLPYRAAALREKPVYKFKADELLRQMHLWRDARREP